MPRSRKTKTDLSEMEPATIRHRFRVLLDCPRGVVIPPGGKLALFFEVDSIVCGERAWDSCPTNDGNKGRSTAPLPNGLVMSLFPSF